MCGTLVAGAAAVVRRRFGRNGFGDGLAETAATKKKFTPPFIFSDTVKSEN
jgi:hypothetical protein